MKTPQTNPLLSLSPLDGRYKAKCEELSPFFSEYGLIFYRLRVEIEWLKTLCNCSKMVELSAFKSSDLQSLDSIIDEFSLEDAQRVKDIEKITKTDLTEFTSHLSYRIICCKKNSLDGLNKDLKRILDKWNKSKFFKSKRSEQNKRMQSFDST